MGFSTPMSLTGLALVLTLLADQQQVFRSGTELVEVDVVVLDSTGRLVRGLTAEDFELYDEGKLQEVSTFSFVEAGPELIAAGAGAMTEPGLSSSEAHRGSAVYLIIIDDYYSPPQRRGHVRANARQFVRDHMRPGDLAAVLHVGPFSTKGVEFSGSKPHLVAAIDSVKGGAGYSGDRAMPDIVVSGDGYNLGGLGAIETLEMAVNAERMYESLELAAEYVGGFTGRRKSILLFSGGVPIDLTGMSEPSSRFRYAHQRLVEMARQANVAVYAIDSEGLNSVGNRAIGPLGGHHQGAPDRGSEGALRTTLEKGDKADALHALALETGGRAILHYNDMATPFAQIARDNGSFYLLGFRPESTDPNEFREIRVRVKRQDVQVFARLGYGGDAKRNKKLAATIARAWEGKTVADLLDRPLPGRSSGLPMRASASVIRRTATGTTALLVVEVDAGAIPANATKLDVGYRAIGADGKSAAARVEATNMKVSPRTRAAIDANGWRYLTTIDLPPGPYQLRVAAREETSGAYGTVFLDIAVPDLARETIAIDSVVIGSSMTGATPTAAPQRELLQIWPVLPTTRREFSRSETLVAFIQLSTLKVEQASVRVEVEDADGRPVAGTTYEAGPESLKTGGAPIPHQVPLAAFAPGDYVLKISTTPPNAPEPAATRAIPFNVR